MRQRFGLTVSGGAAPSLMKLANFERSQTVLPFALLITPSSGNRAIKPRRALAKSALSDHGREEVDVLLNSRVDGDAGLGSPDVCACAIVAPSANAEPKAKAAVVMLNEVKTFGGDPRLKRLARANVALPYLFQTPFSCILSLVRARAPAYANSANQRTNAPRVCRETKAATHFSRLTSQAMPSNSEIPVLQLRLGHELLGGAVPHRAAALDDVMPIANPRQMLDILVDHQNGLP